MKRILVLEEKHGNRYFDASTDKLLAQASLIVLKERYEEGGWYFKPSEPSKPDFTEEQASELPPSLKPAAMEFLRLYNCQLLRYREELDDYERIERAIASNNGWLAWNVLHDRSGYEYETCNPEDLIDAGKVTTLWPPVPIGTKIITTKSCTVRGEVPESLLGDRRWGVEGRLISDHDENGLRFIVQYEDGVHGSYKLQEFKVLREQS